MIFWIFILVVACFAIYVLLPFFDRSFRGKRISSYVEEKENLEFQKEELLSSLNDLEYDFQLKKIAESDYQQLKDNITRQAIELMKRLDDLDGRLPHAASSDASSRKVRSAR